MGLAAAVIAILRAGKPLGTAVHAPPLHGESESTEKVCCVCHSRIPQVLPEEMAPCFGSCIRNHESLPDKEKVRQVSREVRRIIKFFPDDPFLFLIVTRRGEPL